MTRIAITGATGYIGRHVTEQLVTRYPTCHILTLNRDIEKAKQLLPYEQCQHVAATDFQALKAFRPNVIIHLAAYSTAAASAEEIEPLIAANITYGTQLLQSLSWADEDLWFFNTGSFAEYRNGKDEGTQPAYLYTATKAAFRHILRFFSDLYGFRYLTAIPYSVYGAGDTRKKMMDYLFEAMDSQTPIAMTAGEQILDFVHVDDVTRFYVEAIEHLDSIPSGSDFHLGTGKGTSIRAVASLIEQLYGKPLHIQWGARAYRPLDVMHAIAPKNDPAFWQARISLAKGLKRR